jgi:AcrR family transcriptional regulator
VLGKDNADWRTSRRAAASADIVAAAWELAREHGLSGLSLRDLARRLGMAAPSLYSYFDSKHGLYDAMYADGYRSFLAMGPPATGPDLRAVLRSAAEMYVRFAADDPVRWQLLNQRTIPGFEPSEESYALATEAYERTAAPLHGIADVTQPDLDLIGAVVGGLISQQLANEPGGTRWVSLLDDAVDLLVQRIENKPARPAPARGRRPTKGEA